MNALDHAQSRHTCKAYDKNKKIEAQTFERLLECLRLSPSSINIQPWQFLIAHSEQAKTRITKAMLGDNSHNAPKVMNASHVLIFCTHVNITSAHLDKVLQAEKSAGRFRTEQSFDNRKALCQFYIDQYAKTPEKLTIWAEQQTFIALGQLLFCAQLMGIQATAIGGYDATLLDDEFDLKNQNLKSSVIVALGYADDSDFNKNLPKARLSSEDIFIHLP